MWALGNISGDSPEFRDMVISAGAVAPVLEHMKPLMTSREDIVYLRNVAWALSNFCRGKPFVNHKEVGDGPAIASPSGKAFHLNGPTAGNHPAARRDGMGCALRQISLHVGAAIHQGCRDWLAASLRPTEPR